MQEKARVQRFALLGIKVSSFKYFLGNLYIIIVIISILFYYLCVFRKNRRKFTKPAEFGGKTAGIGCSLIFSESTHIGLSFGTTLNILSQNEDFDGFCLLSNSTITFWFEVNFSILSSSLFSISFIIWGRDAASLK